MRKIKWLASLALIVNIVFGLLLLLSLSSHYIDPLQYWLPSLMGLAFLHLLAMNMLFSFIWLLVKRKYLWVSLFFLVFGLTELPNHLQFNFDSKAKTKAVKLLSFNVRNFDLYNWSHNKKTRDKIMKTISRSRSNIICLQEFFNTTDPQHDFKTLDTILQFKTKYKAHVEYTTTVKETEHWGIATFSSYPILNMGKVVFENQSNNICIFSDLLIEKDTIRVYNVHLASVKFGQKEYQYIEKVGDKVEDDVIGLASLTKKLRKAFGTRSKQAQKVKDHMNTSPYPVILCGDFNDTPTSYTYKLLSKNLHDSFRKRGNGFGTTYNGKLPFLRIDYVMTDPSIGTLKHEVIHSNISDHYPLNVNLEIIH